MKIEIDGDQVFNKKIGRNGKVGVVYLPKELIGRKVTVIVEAKK